MKTNSLRLILSSVGIVNNDLARLLKPINKSTQNFELRITDTGLPICIHKSDNSILASCIQ